MNKVMKWPKGKQYKFTDPEYKKFWKQAMVAFLVSNIGMVIIGLIFQSIVGDADYTGKQQVWVIFIGVFLLISGYTLGCANTAELADKYQAKKDKKNEGISISK